MDMVPAGIILSMSWTQPFSSGQSWPPMRLRELPLRKLAVELWHTAMVGRSSCVCLVAMDR